MSADDGEAMEGWLRSELQQLYQAPMFVSSDPHETRVQTGQAFKEHELRWQGGTVDVDVTEQGVFLGANNSTAKIIAVDVATGNGVIHIIDTVLLP